MAGDEGDGLYAGELNGELVASYGEIAVADGLGYGSLLYVDERRRGRGLARRLMDVADERTSDSATVGIDAHGELEAMYTRRGFETQFAVTQFTGRVQPEDNGGSGSGGGSKSKLDIRQVTDMRIHRVTVT